MAPHSEATLTDLGTPNGSEPSTPNGSEHAHQGNGFHSSLISSIEQNNRSSVPHTNGRQSEMKTQGQKSPYLTQSDPDSEFDLICVGFGPASLAIAVALHDAIASGQQLLPNGSSPKILFIEKQTRFAWHAGMLLPGAKMQISFVKDLATLRDPRSEFTFLNYLHRNGRLVDFTNLGTFLPARVEYEDYLRWCASFFEHLVQYGQEVVSVSPETKTGDSTRTFAVRSRNPKTGETLSFRGRNVLIAAGGQPNFPKSFPAKHPRIIHSSQYAYMVPEILSKKDAPYRVAVLGAGQSAAEIFHNIQTLYPNSKTALVMRPEFLKPSDDSPFVNSVFNPEYIDTLFPKSARHRNNFLTEARATNYGVVRLNLIEEMYERQYDQKRELGPDEKTWPHRIMGGRQITSIEPRGDALELKIQHISDSEFEGFVDLVDEETLEVDLLIAATGYQRNAHVGMLRDTWDMLPKASPVGQEYHKGITGWKVETDQGERKLAVSRDYQVQYKPGSVAKDSGIWLQGCCEGTHGLSDTLLSVLATRSAEIVNSIFPSSK
ncbi:L-ornithine N(5)-monooxygenase [Trichoderma asperellum]|uniref:L-ornithine N(5)-monooxygenase [NAD(P)H] n=1 Tax=Trichoderma asperellum TaxID=101201 RepID=A0A6V8QTC6_TRIAP|nr:ornithine monooxygenase [Trichoderma asperelloides]GFP55861.1 L-ornithine N(5)-monooxygenase [Trichoderma asperellum]